MLPTPRRREIDHRTIKLIVGLIALSLASLTNLFAPSPLTSVSASYWQGGWSQTIFLGFLFAIVTFLLAYNGYSKAEMLASKAAAVAGLGIALFPCGCDGHPEFVPYVHWICAALMFLTLAYFCIGFRRRALEKGHAEARLRALMYLVCGVAIVGAIGVLGLNGLFGWFGAVPRLTYFGEATALMAFGVSWLTASRVLPLLTRKEERFSPLREDQDNPA
jgi:hypothetical protein